MPSRAKVLAAAELSRLLAHMALTSQPKRNCVIVLLSFHAGLRACEIAGMAWPAVLRPDGTLANVVRVEADTAKNGRARSVPMHAELRAALRVLHGEQGQPLTGPVVRSQRGGHMTARSIVNWFAGIYAETGLQGCSSHSGRRTFITNAAKLVAMAGRQRQRVAKLRCQKPLSPNWPIKPHRLGGSGPMHVYAPRRQREVVPFDDVPVCAHDKVSYRLLKLRWHFLGEKGFDCVNYFDKLANGDLTLFHLEAHVFLST
jgi:integrase/recombinase XerD